MKRLPESRVASLIPLVILAAFHLGATACGKKGPAATPGARPGRPNILVILTDDQRWDSLGCYGNERVRTPTLDRLAADGARADGFYVAIPLCCPSRATFLTGLHAHETGLVCKGDEAGGTDIPEATPTVATHLRAAGYRTGFVGKAHLGGDPRRWGFEDAPVVLPHGGCERMDPTLIVEGLEQIAPGHVTTTFASSAIEFLRANRSRPWLLWLATTSPHAPFDKPSRPASAVPPPGWPPDQPFDALDRWARYDASVEKLDTEIGRVLAELERLDLAEGTLVIFTSDNGLMLGSHDQLHKDLWYEESSRVPCLMRWPAVVPAGSRLSLGSSVDVLPTCLDAAGLPIPPGLEGTSLLAALEPGRGRSAVFSAGRLTDDPSNRGNPWFMARSGDLKLVIQGRAQPILYDLARDPHERTNAAANPALADELARLDGLLDAFMARGDAERYFEREGTPKSRARRVKAR